MSTTFRYHAVTANGREVRGELLATSPGSALEELRRQALVPVAVEEAGTKSAEPNAWFGGRTGADEGRAAALRTIATMVSGGASLDRALDFAASRTTQQDVARPLRRMHDALRRGDALSAAFARESATFGALAAAVARAGEESGALDEGLARLADHYDRARELRAQLQQALWYPALMGVATSAGIVILLLVVIPRFVSILGETGGALPLSTRLLMGGSAIVRAWWWLALLVAAAGIALWQRWLADPANRRRWDAARLEWPIVGTLERNVATARFTRAVGMLVRGGVGILGALTTARESITNQELVARLTDATARVARGEPLATTLDGILPPLATQLLAVGEESGTLGEMALRVADEYDREAQRATRTLVALVEPTLIVAFGGIVGFVALALLQAVYSINGTLR